ncbi:hypothetical protein A3A64_03345 [Candidatus Gottesmanbacteria bacterium RIFCSPLOWO2_01_FULL_48_11]|uniref:Uncharacterized protein n=2 Tax=Candidatus Gottesmaniibacteriota TaxID=1752720 RepID=A0A0G1XLH4_9BACT|nr:MAG: hypothetical protein UY27_C0025G0007 [Candidatus Gottesmanbacteria bacterium GW2011_GWA1_48_13]OGG27762.1 MAG: hypothetical protein A3A64_03345 [Candidatus Gottesmanbacteria bacterium RIFCSPLOWO2_01_FULL_48_11]
MMPVQLHTSKLRLALERQARHTGRKLRKNHPHAVSFLEKRGIVPGKLREHAARIATTGALAGAMLLTQPIAQQVRSATSAIAQMTTEQLQQKLTSELVSVLPKEMSLLTPTQEQQIANIVQTLWGVRAVPELDGERLNRSYGFIGAEQHLPRFPGDSVDQHDGFQRSGITPGLGAWGYFAPSKQMLTQDLIEKEKWYVAVQTLYLPDWNTRFRYLRDWYKYRKVLVINPTNGKTVAAVVADAGPANWTGKHYGGSPEVMAYLGLNVGMQKGAVVLFFVDDANNEIPLGPVEYNFKLR